VYFYFSDFLKKLVVESIPCPFLVGWVKRQRKPTLMLGFMLQPNLQIKAFFNLDKVLTI